MASWLVRSTPRAVRVRALAGDIVLSSWARHFTLTITLSTQVYRPANLMPGGNPAMHPIQGGVEILSVTSCYRNRDMLRPDGPDGSKVDFTFSLTRFCCHIHFNSADNYISGRQKAMDCVNLFNCFTFIFSTTNFISRSNNNQDYKIVATQVVFHHLPI